MATIRKLCGTSSLRGSTIVPIMPIDLAATRSLTVELSETEWLALRTLERDPVAYLKQQITRRLTGDESAVGQVQTAYFETDDY